MSYFYYEENNEIKAVSSSFWAIVDFCHPRLIKWSETLPGDDEPKSKVESGPKQIVRPKKFKARADLLTAAHWRG